MWTTASACALAPCCCHVPGILSKFRVQVCWLGGCQHHRHSLPAICGSTGRDQGFCGDFLCWSHGKWFYFDSAAAIVSPPRSLMLERLSTLPCTPAGQTCTISMASCPLTLGRCLVAKCRAVTASGRSSCANFPLTRPPALPWSFSRHHPVVAGLRAKLSL